MHTINHFETYADRAWRRRTPLTSALVTVVALVACGTPTVTVLPPTPDAMYGPASAFAAGSLAHSVFVADVSGDARLDLVVAVPGQSSVAVLRGSGGRSFGSPTLYSTGAFPKHAIAVDVDGDGVLDIVTANQESGAGEDVSVLLGLGDGTFAPAVHFEACANPHHVAVGNFDGGPYLDIAVACWGQAEIAMLQGVGGGAFGPYELHLSGGAPHSLIVADLDGDGFEDIAVANLGGSSVGISYGNGDGTFEAVVLHPVGASPHSIQVADLRGSGVLDLVTANQGSDEVSVLLGSGGRDYTVAHFAAGSVPKDVAIGDLDGDGNLDLVTANTHGNYPDGTLATDVSVLAGRGDGTFAPPVHFAVAGTPFSVAVADLDGDGRLDVVTANWHSNDVAVLYHQGTDLAGESLRVSGPR